MLPARNDEHLLVFVRSLKAWRERERMQWGAWCMQARLALSSRTNMLICGSAQDLEVRDPSAPMPQSNYVGATQGRDLPDSCTVLIKNLKSTGANLRSRTCLYV